MGYYRQTDLRLAAMVAHLELKFHNSHSSTSICWWSFFIWLRYCNCCLCIPCANCGRLETAVYLCQMNLPEGLKPELSLSLWLEACPKGLRVWARVAKPVTGWPHSGRERLGQAGQSQSGHSARHSVSKYNTAIEICIGHKWSLLEAYMTCSILPQSAIWENSILFPICRKLGVEKELNVVQ